MASTQRWIVAFTALALSGCVSSTFSKSAQGALIGAASGAALGAGTGVLISNDKLLGSSKQSQFELSAGSSIGAGALIGGVFGAIVGAMVGHQHEDNLPLPAAYGDQANQHADSTRF